MSSHENRLQLALYLLSLGKDPRHKIKEFKQQDAFINDPSQFIAALCTRRAGKTNALAIKFKKAMDKHPGSLCRYIALTRDSARDIMWPVLQEMDEKYSWDAQFHESTLVMKLPNGSKLRLLGADMTNFIRRLKGAKSPAVAIDESQEFGDHLSILVDDVLTPTIADYKDSWIALTGTPGPIPRGMFFDITEGGVADFSVHKWSLYDNPYLPDAREFVAKLKARKKWEDTNPTYRREYLGQWVIDFESLLIKYDSKVNDYDSLPMLHKPYHYILGVDIGLRDSDALAVLAWHDGSPNIYLVEEIITANQDITTLSSQIQYCIDKYNPDKIVMDEGALGKKIAEEIRRRRGLPIHAADKARKMENIAFLNDWMRLGQFKAKRQSRFAHDCEHLQIDYDHSTSSKIVVKKGFHSDIIDSVLYAFKESPAFTYKAPDLKLVHGSKEWSDNETKMMEEAAYEKAVAQQRQMSGYDWDQ